MAIALEGIRVLDMSKLPPFSQATMYLADMEADHPTVGKVKQQGFPIKFSETPMQLRNFEPFDSEHAEELLAELGYKPEQIEALRKDGIIG